MLIGGKVAFVAGYGDVGKGAAEALRGQGARVIVSEIDPINALQAAMDGYQVARLESVVGEVDILITGTGNRDVVTVDHLLGLKHLAIVGNVGHFDDEIDMAGLEAAARRRAHRDQAAGARVAAAQTGRSVLVLQRGPPDEPRQRHRAPVVRHEQLVHQPGARPARAVHQAGRRTRSASTCCRRCLDEKVARLHLEALGVGADQLTDEQSAYLGVPVDGPYKLDHYRY